MVLPGLLWFVIGCGTSTAPRPPSPGEAPGPSVEPTPAPAAGEVTPARAIGAGEPEPPEAGRCRFESEDDDACFVRIPGGTFLMGAQATDPAVPGYDPAATPEEGPPHEVEVSPFWIMRNEVSVSLYARCVEARACDPEAPAQGGVSTWRGEAWRDRIGHPLNSVDWATAQALCAYVGGRLPSEAEWEIAARGTDGRRWPWGNEPGCGVVDVAGYTPSGTLRERTMMSGPCENLGTRPGRELRGESPYRLTGMAGSLWEWTLDAWDPGAYAHGPRKDPRVTGEGPLRVQRGGGWTSTDPVELRTTVRQGVPADQKLVDVGVRCVWGAP